MVHSKKIAIGISLSHQNPEFDITIIGAGVVGLAIAKYLSEETKYSVLVVEKNDAFGTETSSRNSEVIHSGIFNHIDSLKYKFCIEGNKLLYNFSIVFESNQGYFFLTGNYGNIHTTE